MNLAFDLSGGPGSEAGLTPVAVAPTGESSLAAVLRQVSAFPGVRTALPVLYAQTTGYQASAHGSTTSASAGLVLGVPGDYRAAFPGELRQFIGSLSGVLIAQQMAANLGVGVGDGISIGRAGMPDAHVRVDGVIDFTAPEQLLSPVGIASTSTPAPVPDNVLIVPVARWRALFGELARRHPALIRRQVHANLARAALPRDPSDAYSRALGLARNLEARTAGRVTVGNNLATALDAARGDSLYARAAFLFLGLPGALLAVLLTGAIAGAGAERRRRDQALLRTRGATISVLVRLALAESVLVGLVGGAVGLASAVGIGAVAFDSSSFGATRRSKRDLGRRLAARRHARRDPRHRASRLARRALVDGRADAHRSAAARADRSGRATASTPCWRSLQQRSSTAPSGGGSQLVLVVEGATQASVDHWSFLAPMLAWIGIALLTYRLGRACLRRGRSGVAAASRPFSGNLGEAVASSMSPATRFDRARPVADRLDDLLRRHHGSLQRDLPAASRGGRPAVQRRRRRARRDGGIRSPAGLRHAVARVPA
jgi:putative ABC transport system permease protein